MLHFSKMIMQIFQKIALITLSCLLIVLALTHQSVSAEKDRLAVLNLNNAAQLSEAEVDFLTNLIRQAIAKRGQKDFIVMTQENILLLLPPDKKIEECVSECEVDTGRLLGAKYIITGTVLKFGESLRVNLKFHETQNAALINSYTVKGNKVEDLETGIENAAQELFNELLKSKQSQDSSVVAIQTKSEVKAETKAEIKAEVKPEVKAEVKPEVKPEIKAEVKPEVKSDLKDPAQRKFLVEFGSGLYICRKDSGDTCKSDQDFQSQPIGVKFNFHYFFSKNIMAGFEFSRNVANLKIPEDTPKDFTVTWSNIQQLYLASIRYVMSTDKIDISYGLGFGKSDFSSNLNFSSNAYLSNYASNSVKSTGFVTKFTLQAAYKFNRMWSLGAYFDYVLGGTHQVSEYCTNYDQVNNQYKINSTCYTTSTSIRSYLTKTSLDIAAYSQIGIYAGISF